MRSLPLVREGLKRGDFTMMGLFMKSNPQTLAELLQDPAVFKELLKATERTNMKLSAALFLFSAQRSLTPGQKRIAKAALITILMQLASKISARGIRSTKRVLTAFKPGLDEMEIEDTLENMLGKKYPDYDDIIMVDKTPRQRGIALMLDVSNSMQREKILLAALSVGVLAYKLKGEPFAVLAFSHKVDVIKPIDAAMAMEDLLDRMLEITPQGATDIHAALEKGLEQLSKQVAREKLGIIITDGQATLGDSPARMAADYPRLHVLQVPIGVGGGDDRTCLRMAQEGRGKRRKLKNFEEIPGAILEILK